jgi:hypothetical protein
MDNPNATNPVTRASGDRNEGTEAVKDDNSKHDMKRKEDLRRQAKGTQVTGPAPGAS